MRDLLARASQDHVYEQRSQDAAVDEIRQRLEGLEWLTRELRERELGGLVGQLEGVQSRLNALTDKAPGWAETLAEHIEKVGERVTPLDELPGVRSEVGAVAENLDDALNRIQTLTDSAQRSLQQVETLTERMENLQVSMEGAALRFSRLDKALGDLNQRSDRLEAQVNTIGELMTGGLADLSARTEQQLGEVTDNVRSTVSDAMNGSIPQHLDGVKETVEQRLEAFGGTVRTGMDSVGVRVETMTGRIESLDGRLEGLDGRLEGIDGRVDGVDGRLEGVQGRLDGVEGHFDGVNGRFDGIEGRFEKIDGHFEGVGGRFDKVDGHFEKVDGHFEKVDGQFERVDGQFEGAGGRFDKIDGHFDTIDGKVDTVDDRLEAVNQRVGQLPATLDIAELRTRLGELAERPHIDHSDRLDALDKSIGENVRPISDAVRARPDREEVEETISKIVDSSHGDISKRLASLEETVLALAEALLRPAREGKSGGKAAKGD
jgi:chromosome segregation ATPase